MMTVPGPVLRTAAACTQFYIFSAARHPLANESPRPGWSPEVGGASAIYVGCVGSQIDRLRPRWQRQAANAGHVGPSTSGRARSLRPPFAFPVTRRRYSNRGGPSCDGASRQHRANEADVPPRNYPRSRSRATIASYWRWLRWPASRAGISCGIATTSPWRMLKPCGVVRLTGCCP